MSSPPFTRDFHPISVETISTRRVPDMDCYLQRNEDKNPILYRSRSLPLSKQDFRELLERGYRTLWVLPQDYRRYEDFLSENLITLIRDPSVSVEAKCEVTYNISSQIMQEVFNSSDPQKVIEASDKVLNSVIEVIFASPKAAHNFIVRTSMDYALYTHSINVCLFGMALARRALKISKQDAMTRYGPGLLLHDLGILSVPKEILQKDGSLTPEEWEIMYRHPSTGLEMVKEIVDVTQETETIILHHHERLDGSGYPFGLKGPKISIAARICAIADVFDAINTRRPFRERKPSFDALKTMQKELPHRLDENLYREFVYLFLAPQE